MTYQLGRVKANCNDIITFLSLDKLDRLLVIWIGWALVEENQMVGLHEGYHPQAFRSSSPLNDTSVILLPGSIP